MTEHSHSYPEGATLLPCPFCGKPAAFCCLEAELGSPASFWVNCSCGVETPERRTEEEAVALWNTRPDGVAQAAPRPPAGDDSRYLGEEILELQDEIKGLRADLEAKQVLVERLSTALGVSIVAIDDWLNIYAEDHCDAQRVKEAKARVHSKGTLWYIATVQEQNRSALSALSSTDPRCTCAAIVNPNIPHARSCPLSSTSREGQS